MANRTNHTSSDQSITPTQSDESDRTRHTDTTREQLLALLGELTEKLEPAPAPKLETVNPGALYLPPLYEARKALEDAFEEAKKAAIKLEEAMKVASKKILPARNERAWKHIFDDANITLRDMVDVCGWQAKTINRQAIQMAHLLIMAADGDPEAVATLQESESHE